MNIEVRRYPLRLVLPILLLGLGACDGARNATAPPCDFGAEQYAVYSTIISSVVQVDEMAVVSDMTWENFGNLEEGDLPDDFTAEVMDIVDSFNVHNQEPARIESRFSGKTDVILASEARMTPTYLSEAWVEFYRLYPEARELLRLSSVGFDQSCTRALAGLVRQQGIVSGGVYYFYLEKSSGEWTIRDSMMSIVF